MTGPVPAWLGSLPHLRRLYLANNELTGPIPSELGRLVNLEVLVICWNGGVIGPIPSELGNLVNLTELNLQGNRLTGPIPASLGNLIRLRELYLYENDLTGPIPSELRGLVNLSWLDLQGNRLTGPIPAWLGNLARLWSLNLSANDLTGPIPGALATSGSLSGLNLSFNWGLSGPLPADLRLLPLRQLEVFSTQTCAPGAWRDWLETMDSYNGFNGRLCEERTDVTIDVAVAYTPAARAASGGSAGIEAVIDLMIAETNQAYAASGVHHRVALVDRFEVRYTETHAYEDLNRLLNPSDGHLDEMHAVRDRVGADLVHLIVGADGYGVCGRAQFGGAFGLTLQNCGGRVFAHELGHNMGLHHDRYEVSRSDGLRSHPAHGYVNQRGLDEGATPFSQWRTIMSYSDQCLVAGVDCSWLPRFSNPRQHYNGDALGIPYRVGESGLTGPADGAAVLDATGPAVGLWRDRPAGANEPPVAVGTLAHRELTLHGELDVDVSEAFVDPDGDALRFTVASSAPNVVTVLAAGARVTLTAAGGGAATIRVTATDSGGLSATQLFMVTVTVPVSFTDDPIVPGVTPIRAVHFTELRARIDAVVMAVGLEPFS